MGNVNASSAPPPEAPLLKPVLSEMTDQTEVKPMPNSESSESNNPGTMEDLHKKCKDVFPMIFEGAKFMVNKGLSSHFQITHSITMSTINPQQSGYKFGATYVGSNSSGPGEVYPILVGDIDPSGNLNANIIHQIHPRCNFKFMYKIQNNKSAGHQGSLDYKGDDFTASLTAANLDPLSTSGVMVGHYLQSITRNLSLGAEIAYQFGASVPGYQMAILNAAGRYATDTFTASGTIGAAGIHTCYYQKCSPTLQIGVELETSLRAQESVATIAYQVDLPKANFVFRGMVDSTWQIGAVIEKKLQPLPFSFSLCGSLNHRNGQFRLGCGFVIG